MEIGYVKTEPDEERLVEALADKNSVSPDAVRTILRALRRGGGTMAQFSHPDFGGMSQWSPGMSMVGDMFNTSLKAKLDAICGALADHIRKSPGDTGHAGDRSATVSYSAGANRSSAWWPSDLGEPGSAGSQNNLQYAAFPGSHRLAINDGGRVTVYDTGDHRITGFSQSQGSAQTATFTSQKGIVQVADLPVVSDSTTAMRV